MTKQEVRCRIGKLQKELTPEYRVAASAKIQKKILELPEYQQAKTIFCYVSMKEEVQTFDIIKDALSKGKKVVVPLCIGKHEMEGRQITSLEELTKGYFDILEPNKDTIVIEKDEIDLGIIPCVSADRKGNRLGHGAGYYDRYLGDCTFKKVLICFEQLLQDEIPIDAYDIVMDQVISEK